MSPAVPASVPRHLAVIMDGNGRWAERRRRPRVIGHRAGARAVNVCIDFCLERGIGALTLFAFSSENWGRPEEEVGALMKLFLNALDREVDELHLRQVRVRFIGDRARFSSDIRGRMDAAEVLTRDNGRLHLVIAASYGGRQDIAHAARALAADVAAGRLRPEDIDIETVSGVMYTAGQKDPDFILRPSGEHRLSNFMLWQASYAEFVDMDVLWPDFTRTDLDRAIEEYNTRSRRFGGI